MSIMVYVVKYVYDDIAECSCYEQLSLNLPCRHIFFLRNELELELFNIHMVPTRHNIVSQIIEVNTEVRTMVTNIENINTVASMRVNKNQTEKSKYNTIFRLAQEVCNSAKYLDDESFESILQSVIELKSSIDNKIYKQINPTVDLNTNTQENLSSDIQNDEEIASSQSSTETSSSQTSNSTSTSVFSVVGKSIIKAPKIGRKKLHKKKTDFGQLSLYAPGAKNTTENAD